MSTTLLSPGTLHVADLPPAVRAWLLEQRYDHFVEKHEGPHEWRDLIEPGPYEQPDGAGGREVVQSEAAEFTRFDDFEVLLPVERSRHSNLRRLRAVPGDDGRCLTLFLTDSTGHPGPGAGRFAFCEMAPDGGWFLCTVWHEWYPSR